MVSKNTLVRNSTGIHTRPASLFVKAASQFQSDIYVEKEDKSANGKSMLGVLSLCINCGSIIKIRAEGPDEEAAVYKLVELVETGLEE